MNVPAGKTYYIVNCKTGDAYGKCGSFSGMPKSYKQLNSAADYAQRLADYYRIPVRVDDQDGNEVTRCDPKGR